MALSSPGGNTDKISHGNAAALQNINIGTAIVWMYIDDTSNSIRMFASKTNSVGGVGWFFDRESSDGTKLALIVNRATANQTATTATATLTTGWHYVAATWNLSAGGPKLYRGTLTTAAADVTASPVDGSGAIKSDAAVVMCFANTSAGNFSFPGDIAFGALFSTALSLTQIQQQQRMLDRPVDMASRLIFTHYGLQGTGTQADWSGNGHNGTVTGSTVAPHVPLPIFAPVPWVVQPSGAGPITGAAAITLGALTAAGTGTVAIAGASAITLGALTASGAGTVAIAGAAAITLEDLTASGAGTVAISGSSAVTLDALTAAGVGTVDIAGAAALTLDALLAAGVGTVSISGAAAITLASLTVAGAGTVDVVGAAAITLDTVQLTATGTGPVSTGDAAITLNALVASGAGTVDIAGLSAITLQAVTAASTGQIQIVAVAAIVLDSLTMSATVPRITVVTIVGSILGVRSTGTVQAVRGWGRVINRRSTGTIR